jgi:hypothetical protein
MYAFMAIVAHYVNKDGQLGLSLFLIIPGLNAKLITEELLIDFREMLGAHSGENMAEAVWETLVMYGIEGRVVKTFNS